MSSKRGRFFLPPCPEFQISRPRVYGRSSVRLSSGPWKSSFVDEGEGWNRFEKKRGKRNPINVNFAKVDRLSLGIRTWLAGLSVDLIRGKGQEALSLPRVGRRKGRPPPSLVLDTRRKLIRLEAPQGSPTFLFPMDISRGENKSVLRPVPMQLR